MTIITADPKLDVSSELNSEDIWVTKFTSYWKKKMLLLCSSVGENNFSLLSTIPPNPVEHGIALGALLILEHFLILIKSHTDTQSYLLQA